MIQDENTFPTLWGRKKMGNCINENRPFHLQTFKLDILSSDEIKCLLTLIPVAARVLQ